MLAFQTTPVCEVDNAIDSLWDVSLLYAHQSVIVKPNSKLWQ